MYLSRLTLNDSRVTAFWLSNRYRVHQRLLMACGADPRMLFRLEQPDETAGQILVQTHLLPDWQAAFADFRVLARPVEVKSFELRLTTGGCYQFRLLANPTQRIKGQETTPELGREDAGKRVGLIREDQQLAWLVRKGKLHGFCPLKVQVTRLGFLRGQKAKDEETSSLKIFTVQFDGLLEVTDADRMISTVERGIGTAKSLGCGLLSLAHA